MTSADCAKIHVTAEVYDFMFIRIEDPLPEKDALQYEILTNEGDLILKGIFRGSVIQLRLSHLGDATYTIILYDQAKAILFMNSFKKYTPAKEEQTMSFFWASLSIITGLAYQLYI